MSAEQDEGFLPLMIYPEGTTSNGSSLLRFKIGAFAPGVPIQRIPCLDPLVAAMVLTVCDTCGRTQTLKTYINSNICLLLDYRSC